MGITVIHAIPMMITCMLQGTLCDTGIPCPFYGENICSVGIRYLYTYVFCEKCKDFHVTKYAKTASLEQVGTQARNHSHTYYKRTFWSLYPSPFLRKHFQFYSVKRRLRGGRGSKIADFETTQFMDCPLKAFKI